MRSVAAAGRLSRTGNRADLLWWLLLPLALLWLAGCGSSSEESPTAVTSPGPSEVEFNSLRLANEAREDEGVTPALEPDSSVARVARAHSRAMRDQGFFSHVGPDGSGLRRRLDSAGISYRSAAENLAQVHNGSQPALLAHQQLMSSPDHRANILSDRYELAGIGVARDGDTYWITQIFIRR